MNPKKVLTLGDRVRGPNARVSLEQPIIQLQTFVSLPTKKITTRKLQAHHIQACAGPWESSRQVRDNETLKKINERRRKDRLPALTLKLIRGDAPGSSVPLATHSATTEEAIVTRPTRRSSRWDVSNEYTENVETEVKTEDSPERLTVSFKFHEDKIKWKASIWRRHIATWQRHNASYGSCKKKCHVVWQECLSFYYII